jgi:hypothetical protein
MLNVVDYIRAMFSSEMLRRHVMQFYGLCSRTVINDFLDDGSTILEISPRCISRDTLQKYGPGLICAFSVCEDFLQAGVLSYTTSPSNACKGYHSMVVLGDMKENREYFRFKFWWPDKQFVEVSADYLDEMGCLICFVGTPQTFSRDSLPSYKACFADNEMVDRPDDVDYREDWVPGRRLNII